MGPSFSMNMYLSVNNESELIIMTWKWVVLHTGVFTGLLKINLIIHMHIEITYAE